MAQQKINFLKFLKEKENKEIPPVIIIKNKLEGYDDENVQLAAVQTIGHAIEYIIRRGITPSEQVQLAAVQKDGLTIRYIIRRGITPSEQVQLAAVQRNGFAIQYIKNPSEEIQLAAVQQDEYLIQFIENPSEQVLNNAKENLIKTYGDIPTYLEKYFK